MQISGITWSTARDVQDATLHTHGQNVVDLGTHHRMDGASIEQVVSGASGLLDSASFLGNYEGIDFRSHTTSLEAERFAMSSSFTGHNDQSYPSWHLVRDLSNASSALCNNLREFEYPLLGDLFPSESVGAVVYDQPNFLTGLESTCYYATLPPMSMIESSLQYGTVE